MATKKNEETEPQELEDSAGVPGQIQYPEVEVDAERAAAFAGGKEDSLYEDENDPRNGAWQNPADNRSDAERRAEAEDDG